MGEFRRITEERLDHLLCRTKWVGDCLVWTGPLDKDGYAKYRGTLVHRLVAQYYHGYSDLTVHHTCEVKPCLNPDHLVWRTRESNWKISNYDEDWFPCGHPRTEENSKNTGHATTKRCRTCFNELQREGYKRREGALS